MRGMRTVLVTGGARGMGYECARKLGETGARVALLDLDEAGTSAAAVRLATEGIEVIACAGDVTDEAQVAAAVERVGAELGSPDILINAAGILRGTRFLDISLAEWNAVLGVSLTGTFLCSRACLPAMIDSGWGRIVNFSSTAGRSVSTLGGAHYTAAKTAVLGLTRAIAKEVAEHGICVNAVCPGLIATEMVAELCSESELRQVATTFPIARLGTPAEVAAMVNFLCSEDAAYVTGASLDINGGDLMI